MSPDELQEHAFQRFTERAGIREYDGGMFRAQAEMHAYNDVMQELLLITDKETAEAVVNKLKPNNNQERLNL